MRMKVTQVGGVTWINDAYNANPQSTFAFINWLKELFLESKGQFYLVLGDMLELGALSQKFHDEIVPYIPDEWQVIVVGDFYSLSFGRKAQCFTNSEDALAGLTNLAAGDAVALKGSRGMRLEMIFKHFEDKEH
jgi:UDP-N-acetylmuramoyl-tripeptide--D-alanyl-D-alanine ligase